MDIWVSEAFKDGQHLSIFMLREGAHRWGGGGANGGARPGGEGRDGIKRKGERNGCSVVERPALKPNCAKVQAWLSY